MSHNMNHCKGCSCPGSRGSSHLYPNKLLILKKCVGFHVLHGSCSSLHRCYWRIFAHVASCQFRQFYFFAILQKNFPPWVPALLLEHLGTASSFSVNQPGQEFHAKLGAWFEESSLFLQPCSLLLQTNRGSLACWDRWVRGYIGKWCGFEVGFALIFLCKSMWWLTDSYSWK